MVDQTCTLWVTQSLLGLALDLRWEETSGEITAILTAAVTLRAGLVLSHAQLLHGSDFESLLLNWGPDCCAGECKGCY